METATAVTENTVKMSSNMDWPERKAATDQMIKNHMYASMGVGLVPLPMVDFLALTAIQIRLLCKLSNFYEMTFSKNRAKNIIGALIGSSLPVAATGPIASLIKAIPLIGQTTGALTMVVVGGASTYALGNVFVQHFESGGTFLDFDPEKVKEYFADLYKEGAKVTRDIKKTAI
ncbi:MAG: DUF697 domain-containing protein [Proteobacteria bacterium]|nr:DUF697 domain-containing protein [Pseudomonadota bacterium]MBU1714688.1 DUF697 domain-containing protein [Pseudomonadota bacterium]